LSTRCRPWENELEVERLAAVEVGHEKLGAHRHHVGPDAARGRDLGLVQVAFEPIDAAGVAPVHELRTFDKTLKPPGVEISDSDRLLLLHGIPP
jgi:hypothetical protein